MKKLLRISTAIFLAFGWLLIAPTDAHSDDPLTVAAQEIQALNKSVDDLNYKDDLDNLIDIAENKFTYAKNAQEGMNNARLNYNHKVDLEGTALEELNAAQSLVDGQTETVATALSEKDIALQEKNDAKDALDLANINLQTAQSNMQSTSGSGLAYTVYNLTRTWPNIATPSGVICTGTWNSNYMSLPVCGNRYENFIVRFTGTITVPSHWTSTYFAGYTDDGFKMYVNGQLAINNWVEQGVRWSAYSPVYDVSENKSLDVEIWWYNGGGPGSYHLGWAIPGGWTGAGCDYTGGWGVGFSCNLGTFSSGSGPTQAQIDAYNSAVTAQQEAQDAYTVKSAEYSNKLAAYNHANSQLNIMTEDLSNKTTAYNTAVSNTESQLIVKNNTIQMYQQGLRDLNNAIDDAWNYYKKQKERELQIAIAQAAANAAANQPKPEPSLEPKPSPKPTTTTEAACDKEASATQCIPVKPSPKPTNPTASENPDPKPTQPEPKPTQTENPKPEPTKPTVEPTKEPEPKPTVEPTPKPTVEPTMKPTPEPTVEPTPEPKPTEKPGIKDEVLAALVPEKGTGTTEDLSGVIANLTSKDNKLVKLSAEQTAAVSQTLKALTVEAKAEIAENLGISAGEVAKIADQMKSNPALASAFVEFNDRAKESEASSATPYTLADVVTEVQMEEFLADPMSVIGNINPAELLSNFSELGSDMTDDQREKAQEVIVPVIIASQIAGAVIRRIK